MRFREYKFAYSTPIQSPTRPTMHIQIHTCSGLWLGNSYRCRLKLNRNSAGTVCTLLGAADPKSLLPRRRQEMRVLVHTLPYIVEIPYIFKRFFNTLNSFGHLIFNALPSFLCLRTMILIGWARGSFKPSAAVHRLGGAHTTQMQNARILQRLRKLSWWPPIW